MKNRVIIPTSELRPKPHVVAVEQTLDHPRYIMHDAFIRRHPRLYRDDGPRHDGCQDRQGKHDDGPLDGDRSGTTANRPSSTHSQAAASTNGCSNRRNALSNRRITVIAVRGIVSLPWDWNGRADDTTSICWRRKRHEATGCVTAGGATVAGPWPRHCLMRMRSPAFCFCLCRHRCQAGPYSANWAYFRSCCMAAKMGADDDDWR